MISLLFCLLLGVVLGSFLAYMIYFIFSIINGLFDCLGDNGFYYWMDNRYRRNPSSFPIVELC